MSGSEQTWTNEEVLGLFLRTLIDRIYRTASSAVESTREAATSKNPNRLRDRLIELQMGVLTDVLGLVDGSSGPTEWPGIRLVNGETGEVLAEELDWELSRVEGEYILKDKPLSIEE